MTSSGQWLGQRYQLLTLIATGGMGEVWKARDRVTGMLVAAKVLRPELCGEEISLSRLRLEAKNAMVARHPNIAAVLDSGQDDGQGWIIMELVDGRPLNDFIGGGRRMSPAELIPILIQTAYALDTAARAGVVHRDIKPANILIRDDGLVKLTDFGVSLGAGQVNLTATGMVMGTAQYLAPEQALGNTATTLGDLYSLGIVAYEALTGERPFTGKNQVDIAFAHVNEPAPPLPEDVPAPLAELITAMIDKDPTRRPQTGSALARRLRSAADELGVTVDLQPLASKPKRPAPVATAPVRHTVKEHLPASDSDFRWQPVGAPAPPTRTTPSESDSRTGMWVIIGLIALTVVLIIVAMVRNAHDEDAGVQSQAAVEEIQAWHMLTTDA